MENFGNVRAIAVLLLAGHSFVLAEQAPIPVPPGESREPVDSVVGGPSTDATLPTKDIILPVRVKFVAPVYPKKARKKHIEGKVIVQAVVRRNGTIGEVVVLTTSNTIFNEAALDAVRQWTFKPALRDGQPVAIYYTISLDFRLS